MRKYLSACVAASAIARRSFGFVAVLGLAAGGCTVHPAPDVALDMQRSVAPATDVTPDDRSALSPRNAAPGAPAQTGTIAQPHQSQILAPPPPHAAPGETELTVLAARNLGGVWRLYTPHRLDISFPGGFTYGRVVMHLCRIVQRGETVSGNCLFDKAMPITGTASGSRVSLTLNGLDFNGQAVSWKQLRGGFRLRVLGLGVTPPVPAGAERLVGTSTLPQPGAEAALRTAIGDVLAGTLHDGGYTPSGAKQIAADLPDFQNAMRLLGPLNATSYLDKQELIGGDGQKLGDMAVFAVDFAQDSRLCGVELTSAGKINRFACA